VTLRWKAPGNDYSCGTARRYQIATSSHKITPKNFAMAKRLAAPKLKPKPAWTTQTQRLPQHLRYVAIRAIDGAGNVGYPASVDTKPGG
jgi:hypothetical protein